MGGFVDPFVPEPAWPLQDAMFIGSSWPAGSASALADPTGTYLGLGGAGAAAAQDQNVSSSAALVNGSDKETIVSPVEGELHEQFLSAHLPDDVDSALVPGTLALGSVLTAPCAISLADPAPVVCCSSNDSSGSEQSGSGLQRFLLGEHQPTWPPSAAFTQISSLVGQQTSQSFGFGNNDLLREDSSAPLLGNAPPSAPLQLYDDVEFNTGKMLSFSPGIGSQQVNTPSTNFGDLQLSQKEFSDRHHLNLTGHHLSSFNATGARHNPEQSTEVSSGKTGPNAPPFMTRRPEVPNGNGAAGSGAPKPRVRARRGQATDPHSIAERLRREKITDRMKNLQELVPNSNRTDKATMLDEIIEYVKFLQLQVKVLSMSRLGATEAVVPLLTESQTESSGGLLLSPRSGSGSGNRRPAGGGGGSLPSSDSLDGAAFEQEVAQLMESNMTTAMQYLQSKGMCLMPIALASAISDQKGASSAAVPPENAGAKEMLRAVKTLGTSPIQGR